MRRILFQTHRCRCVAGNVQGEHQTGGNEVAQCQRRLHEERPARGIATPVLAKTQQAGEQQQQRQHEANHSDDDVEAAPKIAQPHRTAHDAQEADEGAQLKGRERGRTSCYCAPLWWLTELTRQVILERPSMLRKYLRSHSGLTDISDGDNKIPLPRPK